MRGFGGFSPGTGWATFPGELEKYCEKVSGGISPKPLRLHSQSTSLAWVACAPWSRYALTEHKSRLGRLRSLVSLCTHRAQVSPGSLALPGLAMHSQSTSLAWVACAPWSRYAVLQGWLHCPLAGRGKRLRMQHREAFAPERPCRLILRWAGQQSRYFG
ncbi:hypothetical protein C8P63_11439 [Melghirimyces profundicolus]|uniref:Uncharacterized protein n=1 Tax=Melghirimyces profundicolus TaxID=1242148 RepID=A0A2T6BSB9_9BACL|nr:hypothetical protein C8P63_11439 [Melghirimyces profundicolus]